MAGFQKDPSLNYVVTPNDKHLTCPYNPSHRVLEQRFSRHLVKCRDAHLKECKKKNVKPSFLVCRWNTNHHVDSKKLQEHESECGDRSGYVEHVVHQSDPAFRIPGPSFVKEPAVGVEDEDWDPVPHSSLRTKVPERNLADDIRGGNKDAAEKRSKLPPTAYDPSVRLAREPLITNPQGLTPSERKEYRASEFKKWRELKLMDVAINPLVNTGTDSTLIDPHASETSDASTGTGEVTEAEYMKHMDDLARSFDVVVDKTASASSK